MKNLIIRLLARQFETEWASLTPTQRTAVVDDFAKMLLEEYDTPDDTMHPSIAQEHAITAAEEYRRRIGAGNLASYARCMSK